MARQPNVNLQILPATSSMQAALFGPFVVLSFPEPVETDVVYVDSLLRTLYIEEPSELGRYTSLVRRLVAESLPYQQSIELIERIAKGSST